MRTFADGAGKTTSGPKLTGRGWTLLGLGLGLAALGVWKREPAFVHMGLFLALLLAGGWLLARRNLRGLEPEWETPETAFTHLPFTATMRLKGAKGRWGAFHLDCGDEAAGDFGKGLSCRGLSPGETKVLDVETRLRRRGVNPAFRWRLRSSFPAGLWRTSVGGWHSLPLIVFPRPIWPEGLDDPRAPLTESGDECSQPDSDLDGDYLGIREFAPGDPLKLVHWRASARAQRLVVREFDRRLPVSFALFFHSYQPPGAKQMHDAFESALEMLAGLLLRCRENALPLTVMADFVGWRSLALTKARDLHTALTWFAEAKRAVTTDLAPLNAKLAATPAGARVFVVSDTPVRHWEGLLAPCAAEVTCLSVADMRRRSPKLRLRQAPIPPVSSAE